MAVSDTLLGQGYNTPLNTAWRVFFEPGRGPRTPFHSSASPNAFNLNYALVLAVLAGHLGAGLAMERPLDLTVFIAAVSLVFVVPILASFALQGLPMFPHSPAYRHLAPFVLALYLTQYEGLYRSPLWWGAFVLSLSQPRLLAVLRTAWAFTRHPRPIYQPKKVREAGTALWRAILQQCQVSAAVRRPNYQPNKVKGAGGTKASSRPRSARSVLTPVLM